jgi:hypothetical protein
MRRAQRCARLLLAILVLALALFRSSVAGFREHAGKGQDSPLQAFATLKRGMTPEQVRQRVGAPKHIARQLLYHRYREQWIYDAPNSVRLTFDCRRGQKPQLLFSPVLPD